MGSWLPSRLSSTWRWTERIERIFSSQKSAKKPDILSEKQESGMALKKLEFTPESGSVDTYGVTIKLHCDIYLASTIPSKQFSRLTDLSDLPILPLLAFYSVCL